MKCNLVQYLLQLGTLWYQVQVLVYRHNDANVLIHLGSHCANNQIRHTNEQYL